MQINIETFWGQIWVKSCGKNWPTCLRSQGSSPEPSCPQQLALKVKKCLFVYTNLISYAKLCLILLKIASYSEKMRFLLPSPSVLKTRPCSSPRAELRSCWRRWSSCCCRTEARRGLCHSTKCASTRPRSHGSKSWSRVSSTSSKG